MMKAKASRAEFTRTSENSQPGRQDLDMGLSLIFGAYFYITNIVSHFLSARLSHCLS
jgi:hypothetical protein